MIKKIFRPKSLLAFSILAVLGIFLARQYMPISSAEIIVDIALFKTQNDNLKNTLSIGDNKIADLNKLLENTLEAEKLPQPSIVDFIIHQPTTSPLFSSKFDLKLFNENQEIALKLFLVPTLYKPEVINSVKEKIRTEIIAHYSKNLNQLKLNKESSITTNQQIIETNKIIEKKEIVATEKPIVKPTVAINNMPREIADNIVKFKEYKIQKENKLKEILAEIDSLPLPNQSPVIMLTSNLQKNYEMQLTVLNSKKEWLKNSDLEELKIINEELKEVQEKLVQENMKLRDDSYFLKGQQDKALRLQHTHLLIDEKNCRQALEALNELQNGLFEQDQNTNSTQPKINENSTGSSQNQEIDEQKSQKIKQAQAEIATLNIELEEIKNALTLLESNGITFSEAHTTVLPIDYVSNPFIIIYLVGSSILLLLITGLLFGASNKVSSQKVISQIFDAPVLGTLPILPNEGLENAKHKKLTDAIDQITDTLSKSMTTQGIKILNVLSPESNEGRTQLAGMLSLSFNLKKNMKVIALDTNFDKPKLADFLELKTKNQSNEDGLIAYINNLVETKEISESDNNQWLAKLVKPCIKNGIFVISPGVGALKDNYSFSSKVITTIYEGLGKYVDLIISDTPALNSNLSFIPKVLAENSTGNILLIRKGVYKKGELEGIKKKLSGVTILGIILK